MFGMPGVLPSLITPNSVGLVTTRVGCRMRHRRQTSLCARPRGGPFGDGKGPWRIRGLKLDQGTHTGGFVLTREEAALCFAALAETTGAGGFVLTRKRAAGKWRAATYSGRPVIEAASSRA
jgi:hypothetical protein